MALGINEFISPGITNNDATAQRSAGQMAYTVNTSTGVVELYRYYQAKDVAAYAIVSGSVLHVADIGLTQGAGDRSNGTLNPLGTTFLGVAQATMTDGYYGWCLRRGVMAGVVTDSGASFAAGTTLLADPASTGDGEAVDAATYLDSSTAANLEATVAVMMRAHIGVTKVAASSSSCTAIIGPLLDLPYIG